MRGQSEAVGALILALMILFMLVGANIILRQQAQIIKYNMKLADVIARRQMENIAFDYRDGIIYATPSTEMDVLAVVVYNDTSVVYVNTSKIRLSVNQWTPLITDPQLASDIYSLRYILGVITGTGNLLTWIPPVTRLVNKTVLVSEVPTGLKVYFVGNNTRMIFSYNISAYAEATTGATYNCYSDLSFNVTPVWSPVLVIYRGSVSITETWIGDRALVFIKGSSGSANITVFANGTLISRTISGTRLGYIRILVSETENNTTGFFDAALYDLGGGVASSISIIPTMTPWSTLMNASIVSVDLLENKSYVIFSVQNTRTSTSSSTCGCSASAVARYIMSPYANSTRPCLSTTAQFAAGVSSITPALYLVILDPATAQSTTVTLQASTPVIQSNNGEGYLANLAPPVRLVLDNRTYIVNNTTWDLNTRANRTVASVNITLPSNTSVTVTGALFFNYTYAGSASIPDQAPTPPPPPPPRTPRIFILQDPLPMNNTPIDTNIRVIVDADSSIWNEILNNMKVNYVIRIASTGDVFTNNTIYFSLEQTPLGYGPVASFNIPGYNRSYADIYVYYNNRLIATATVYNYRP